MAATQPDSRGEHETLPKDNDLPSIHPSKSQKEQQTWHLPGSLVIFNYKPLFGLGGGLLGRKPPGAIRALLQSGSSHSSPLKPTD